jgi:long-chain fatty acid transport protein
MTARRAASAIGPTTEGASVTTTTARLIAATLCIGSMLPRLAAATDGYFSHGYGLIAKGMGGAATALAFDTFGGANNPVSMVWVGNRFDIGVDWFHPQRSSERSGAGFPTLNGKVDSDAENFFIPELGFNKMLGKDLALGISIYGNGGLKTDYPEGNFNCGGGPANMLCGQGRLGVDLMQLIVAPTLALRFASNHSIGVAPLFGYQRFKAEGLQAFDNAPGFPPFTGSPGNVTNRGYDTSTGFGVRVGYQAKFKLFAIGAAYASRMRMSEFDKYKGLFAENGDFDIPENYNVGVALTPLQGLTVALDYQRINYHDVKSVGNSSRIAEPLGSANGRGFGWQNVDVVKLGVSYQATSNLVLRAGYNRSDNPIRAEDVTLNILAPGVVKDHYTVGFTYAVGKRSEVTLAYMHAPRQSVQGASWFDVLLGPGAGGTEKIAMEQNSLGIAYAAKF